MNKAKHETEDRLGALMSDNATGILKAVLGIAIVVLVAVVLTYFVYFLPPPLGITRATLGQTGDYFGGILNPILGFLSVFALLVTLVVQSRELKISTKELHNSASALASQNRAIEHQSIEQTFFAWLNNYHELLQTVTDKSATGRDAL